VAFWGWTAFVWLREALKDLAWVLCAMFHVIRSDYPELIPGA